MAMRMRQSLAQLEQAFHHETQQDRERRERLRRTAARRSRKRAHEREKARSSVRFGLLVFSQSFLGFLSQSAADGAVTGQSFLAAGAIMALLALPLIVGAAREAVPHAEFTAILDCGDDAGAAQGAIRAGVDEVIYTGRADVAERLAAIAVAGGHRLSTQRPVAALDLGQWFFADGETLRRHCADRLASLPAIC